MSDARHFLEVQGDFEMRHGVLQNPHIAYEIDGELNQQADNAVLIFTGLSASAHVASSAVDNTLGWWEEVVGANKPIDTNRFFVICINSLGSCFGSTGPASINPVTKQKYRLDFPELCLEDIADAAALVVKHLGVEQIHSIVGPSMGGMTSLAFLLKNPNCARSLLSISAGLSSRPFAIALRSLQRELIQADPAWNKGNYEDNDIPVKGLQLARKLGMISYRSADEWMGRFGRKRVTDRSTVGVHQPFAIDFEVESYLENHAQKFSGAFDANCYLYLSRAMDLFDVADHGGSIESAMSRLNLKQATVIGVKSDFLFPVAQQEELAQALASVSVDVDFKVLGSGHGHDSFLVDMERFRPVIAEHFIT